MFFLLSLLQVCSGLLEDREYFNEIRPSLVQRAKELLQPEDYSKVSETSLGYFALCLVAKDEQPGIEEWITYHLYKNTSKIYIFDNGSNPPMINILKKFVDSGHIDYFYYDSTELADDLQFSDRFSKKKKGRKIDNNWQYWANNQCMRWFGHRHQFMGIWDVDEFLVLDNSTQTFPEFLKNYEDFGGINVFRRHFGSSGHEKIPNGTVLESYTQCIKNHSGSHQKLSQKQIVNMKYYDNLCHVHFCFLKKKAVDTRKFQGKENDGIWLNHYYYKSFEDVLLKFARYRGDEVFKSQDMQNMIRRKFKQIDASTQDQCLEGIELSKQCCSHLSN